MPLCRNSDWYLSLHDMVTSLSRPTHPGVRRTAPPRGHKQLTQDEDLEQDGCQSWSGATGTVFSCLGCVVGIGNIWRFPRVLASNAAHGGGLAFLLVWFLFLLLWSIPMIMLEFATGRYTRKALVGAYTELIGPRAAWCGMWVTAVSFFIGCYYSVILGWCFYYFVYCAAHDLPHEPEESAQIFRQFAQESRWPILTTALAVGLACLCVLKGVRAIEKICIALVPVMLLILTITFVWTLTRPGSDLGLVYLFKPNWDSMTSPRLWIDALTQNAFDTGASAGLLVPYASYMTRRHGIVRYSTLIPAANNLVSLVAGMIIFSTMFSSMLVLRPQFTQTEVVDILTDSGPGGTGLTFVWLPVLFQPAGILGQALVCLFFLCLSCAGLTSLMAVVEMVAHTLEDWGMRRNYAILVCMLLMCGISQISATNPTILTNQDYVWSFALIINGLLLLYLVFRVGAEVYREDFINMFGSDDWHLAPTWDWVIKYIVPVEAVVILMWWFGDLVYSPVKHGPPWHEIGTETFMSLAVQWLGLLFLLITGNMAAVYFCSRRKYRRGENSRLLAQTQT